MVVLDHVHVRGEVDRVGASAAINYVSRPVVRLVMRPSTQDIVARATSGHVPSGTAALHNVVATASVHRAVSPVSFELILATSARYLVVATLPTDNVVSTTADQLIRLGGTSEIAFVAPLGKGRRRSGRITSNAATSSERRAIRFTSAFFEPITLRS